MQASEVAVESTIEVYYGGDEFVEVRKSLHDNIVEANKEVWLCSLEPNLEGLGTTIVAIVIGGNLLTVGHVGDSRAYLLRDDCLTQLTSDHTIVQSLVSANIISREEVGTEPRRSVVTKSIGHERNVEPDMCELKLTKHDVIVLCSDGLWDSVAEDEIARLLMKYRGNAAARRLIAAANQRGGPDNVSVITVHVGGDLCSNGSRE